MYYFSGDADSKEAMHESGVYGKFLYFLLNFAVKLKLL